MANQFGPGQGYDVELEYIKANDDGTEEVGKLDLSKGPLEVKLSVPGIAATSITLDEATGLAMAHIENNGSVGPFTASVDADGDPSVAGEFLLHWEADFEATPGMGATGVRGKISAVRPTPAP